MIQPPSLKSGDTIAILSTARKINVNDLSHALSVIKNWGLLPVICKTISLEDNQYAGTDDERLADFQNALDDDSIKTILCVRGGYGTVRIIDKIDFSKFIKQPKWIAGYSDITVLHSHIYSNFGIESIHGTMPVNFEKNTEQAKETLRKALFGEKLSYEIPAHEFNRNGHAEGVLVGGNLSLLYNLIGSKSDIDTAGKILFVEDLDEYLYHIDRMMIGLKRAGKFEKLKGLIIGGMTDMRDNTIPFGKSAEEIIKEHVEEYNFPVCFGFPAGHMDDNRALIIGRKVNLSVNESNVMLNFYPLLVKEGKGD